jgi:miniconductance mechanosensitive channel
MREHIVSWLQGLGLAKELAALVIVLAGVVGILVLAYIANLIAKRLLLRFLNYLIAKTETKIDDAFVERRVFARLSHLAPALVIYLLGPVVFAGYPTLIAVSLKLTQIYMILVGALVVGALLNVANDIYRTFDTSKQIPLKGFFQVAKVVLFCIAGIIVLAIILDKTPLYLLSGLGALTAVLLIVFKDPILGFVAGIQLSANKMIAIGDWIEMPSHSADGDVVEVALTTVKVRNWDKTITTIPTYDLITRPFKNWQGMRETGGRRISRSISVDMSTIRFCDEKTLARFSKIQFIKEYLDRKKEELAEHNAAHEVDDASLVNGRRLTNVGTFRAYVEAYLHNHPRIRQDMTFLVRQLAPDEHGLPIQIYVFTNTVAWGEYEGIQADIFDHILAVVPEFDLRVFQDPSGADLSAVVQRC